MLNRNWIKFIFLLVILSSGSTALSAQEVKDRLLEKKVSLHVKDATLIYVLDTLAQDYEIPVGLSVSPGEEYPKNLNIDIENGTLNDVLEAVMRQQSIYHWDIKDGVLNLDPIGSKHDFLTDLLDLTISRYDVKRADRSGLRRQILESVEVKGLMSNKNVKFSRLGDSPSLRAASDDYKIDLSAANVSVRSILNKIVKESRYKIWVVDMVGRNKNDLVISL